MSLKSYRKKLAFFIVIVLVFIISLHLSSQKRVILSIDDHILSLPTRCKTVGEFLEKENISLKQGDKVNPPVETPLKDFNYIIVNRAFPVKIKVDKREEVVFTTKTTLRQFLKSRGIEIHPRDRLNHPPDIKLEKGMEIIIRRAVPVKLIVEEREKSLYTSANTIKDFLEEYKIPLCKYDRVLPKTDNQIYKGMRIRVVHISRKEKRLIEPIAYNTIYEADSNMFRGAKRLLRKGKPGLQERLFIFYYVDGKLKTKELVKTKIIKEPVPQIIAMGTKPKFYLASRGRFAGCKYIEMEATAYEPGPISCGRYTDGYTSTGLKAGYGVVAVDPSVIPLGSRLYIEDYGYAIAGDVGSAIKGKRIDLGFDTYWEAIRFGRRKVKVYILEEN